MCCQIMLSKDLMKPLSLQSVLFFFSLIHSFSGFSFDQKTETFIVNGYSQDGKCSQRAIEDAIKRIEDNNGGILRLKENGTYIIHPTREHVFVLPSNILVEGNGARIFVASGTNTVSFTWDSVFYAEKQKNIIIQDVKLNSNGLNNPVLQKSSPMGPNKHNGLFSALYSTDITIKECVVTDVKAYGCIYLGYCDNVIIQDCEFYDIGVSKSNSYIGDASVIMGVGRNWIVRNNILKNSYLSNCGTGLDLACSNSIVTDNVVSSFWAGANLANNGVIDSHDVLLENNTFINNATAIYLWASIKPYVGSCYNNTIRNNRIEWVSKSGWGIRAIDMSFFVYGRVKNIVVEGNIFVASDIGLSSISSFDIAIKIGPSEKTYSGEPNIGGVVEDVTIKDNVFWKCPGPAIQVERITNSVSINNNRFNEIRGGATKSVIVVTERDASMGPQRVTIDDNRVDGDFFSFNNVFVKGADVRVNGIRAK